MDTSDRIRIKCPFCGKVIMVPSVPDIRAKKVKCPACGHIYPFGDFEVVKERARVSVETEKFDSAPREETFYFTDGIHDDRYRLKVGSNTIGRRPELSAPLCSVPIPTADKGFSRCHFNARVVKAVDGHLHCYISNASNKNTTYVNDKVLGAGEEIALREGDIVRSSVTYLRLNIERPKSSDDTDMYS